MASGSRRRVVVLAAGAWVREIDGLEPAPPVRPVKGQMLALRMERPFELRHVVRGPDAYLAPKADGRLVIGATSEEMGFDLRVTAGGLYRLLEGAVEVVPGVEELEVIETWAGLRPASRDHAPLLGPSRRARRRARHRPLPPRHPARARHRRRTGRFARRHARRARRPDHETSDWLAPFSPQRLGA